MLSGMDMFFPEFGGLDTVTNFGFIRTPSSISARNYTAPLPNHLVQLYTCPHSLDRVGMPEASTSQLKSPCRTGSKAIARFDPESSSEGSANEPSSGCSCSQRVTLSPAGALSRFFRSYFDCSFSHRAGSSPLGVLACWGAGKLEEHPSADLD